MYLCKCVISVHIELYLICNKSGFYIFLKTSSDLPIDFLHIVKI